MERKFKYFLIPSVLARAMVWLLQRHRPAAFLNLNRTHKSHPLPGSFDRIVNFRKPWSFDKNKRFRGFSDSVGTGQNYGLAIAGAQPGSTIKSKPDPPSTPTDKEFRSNSEFYKNHRSFDKNRKFKGFQDSVGIGQGSGLAIAETQTGTLLSLNRTHQSHPLTRSFDRIPRSFD